VSQGSVLLSYLWSTLHLGCPFYRATLCWQGVSVRLSVRPTQAGVAGIVSKRLKRHANSTLRRDAVSLSPECRYITYRSAVRRGQSLGHRQRAQKLVQFGRAVFGLCEWTDRHTHTQTITETNRHTNRHTHHSTLQSYQGEVTTVS